MLARCRVTSRNPAETLLDLIVGDTEDIRSPRPMDPLSDLNAFIHLHPAWEIRSTVLVQWLARLEELDLLLRDCGSAWYVDLDFRGLYRRVDPTVVEAWKQARTAAEQSERPAASRYLAQAWQKVFGMNPEPTDGYGDAVRAVEAVACPVVLPEKTAQGKAIVHHVRNELEKHGDRWRFVLVEGENVDAGHGSVDVVAAMLNRLLRGETERHGLEGRNRPSTQEEAEAAVHLAAVLVQWFSRGAIQPRESETSTPR